jgi:hypothetical protein
MQKAIKKTERAIERAVAPFKLFLTAAALGIILFWGVMAIKLFF